MNSVVKFVDLRAQHEEVRPEIEAAFADIINRSAFIGGSYVSDFEKEFAAYLGVAEAVATGNGTDALWLALDAAGVRQGDLVITVPNTFIATVEGISRVGAFPVFVDIDLATYNMDPAAVRQYLETECRKENGGTVEIQSGRRVAALLPVHLYGQTADMGALLEISAEYGIPLVEDACQAHGAMYRLNGEWKRAGSFGVAAAFSFYPGKNLGAMGEGGAAVTNDPQLAVRMRQLREHGSSEKYIHVTSEGWNARLDTIQTAILSAKLKHLDDWNAKRVSAAESYARLLSGLPLTLPYSPENCRPVYHLYVVRAEDRETLRKELGLRGIETGIHYPIPLHLQKAYESMGLEPGSFPNSEIAARTILSLPMHPALTEEQVRMVAEACTEILSTTEAQAEVLDVTQEGAL